jgi:glycerophosphoryl diester phosphodiesterase
VRVQGHRGARGIQPENTLAAFQYAIDAGADAIEMDIACTADDIPVVVHDPWLADRAPIRALSRLELRRRAPSIPALAEVLALAGPRPFLFNIEIKSFPDEPGLAPPPDAFASLVLAEIDRCRLQARVMIQSFDFRVLRAVRRLAPEIPRGALFEAGDDFAAIAHAADAPIAVPEFHLVSAANVAAAHAAGLEVYTWTPDSPAEWQPLIDAGVDAIITDDPAGLLKFISGR